MKKNIVGVLLVFCIVVSPLGEARAAGTEEFIGGMGEKFVRGIVNIFTGWIEVPAQIIKGYNRGLGGDEGNKLGGAFVGIFSGVWYGLGRTFSGFKEMAGFWAADHKDYDGVGIPLEADYAWQAGEPYHFSDPSFSKATIAPMGNKLVSGVCDTVFGFVELPGQFAKGVKLRAPDAGIGKGIWYWFSRELDGIYDAVTFLLPNPKDTKGLAFDEKWPWSALGDSFK